MELRALEIAGRKAATAAEQAAIERLAEHRATLMAMRAAFAQEALARRHARGEIYSAARVAAIHAMSPPLAELERDVKVLYERQPSSAEVLRTHARTHFVHVLMSSRLLLALHTPDIAAAARALQRQEEAFAAAWLEALGDAAFTAELRQLQREALVQLRTSTRAMHFSTWPASDEPALDDDDAQALGKAWNRLDQMAAALDQPPLSHFIVLPDEGAAGGAPAATLLPVVEALLQALQGPAHKLPGKRATVLALGKVRAHLLALPSPLGRAGFEVDV